MSLRQPRSWLFYPYFFFYSAFNSQNTLFPFLAVFAYHPSITETMPFSTKEVFINKPQEPLHASEQKK